MNKVALVTLWVEPASHQIVKFTYDNVSFDFLPAQWLARVEDVNASMTMSQPFPDVWLPRAMDVNASVTLALGQVDFRVLTRLQRLPPGDRRNQESGDVVSSASRAQLEPAASRLRKSLPRFESRATCSHPTTRCESWQDSKSACLSQPSTPADVAARLRATGPLQAR